LLAVWAKLLCAWLALMHKPANKLTSANNMRCLWAFLTIFPFLASLPLTPTILADADESAMNIG
jgi:hypothetical protein